LRRILILLLALFAAAPAFAQSTLLQGGPWTPGHVPMYVGQGSGQAVVQDSGPAGGGGPGLGLSELGITARGSGTAPYSGQGTGPFGTNVCDFDAPITNPTGYHFLCYSANATESGVTGAIITNGAGGIASPLPLYLCTNGTCFSPNGGFASLIVNSTPISGGANNGIFFESAGKFSQDSSKLYWSDSAGVLGVNLTGVVLPSSNVGTILDLAAASGTPSQIQLRSYGAASSYSTFAYGGTAASPTAVTSGSVIGYFSGWAYNGSTPVGGIAALELIAAENTSSGHQGSKACLLTTPIASTTIASGACQLPAGTFTINPGGITTSSTAALGVNTTSPQAVVDFEQANAVFSNLVSPGTYPTLFQMAAGSSSNPITSIAPTTAISRYEATTADGEGGQNAALLISDQSKNVSAAGQSAQANGLTVYTSMLSGGSADDVSIFTSCQTATGTRVSDGHVFGCFGLFAVASRTTNPAATIGANLVIGNNSGVDCPYGGVVPGGTTCFDVGVFVQTVSTNLTSAGILLYNNSGQFDCGYCIWPGSTKTWSFKSDGFSVDQIGNVLASPVVGGGNITGNLVNYSSANDLTWATPASNHGINFGDGSTIYRMASDGHTQYTSQNNVHTFIGATAGAVTTVNIGSTTSGGSGVIDLFGTGGGYTTIGSLNSSATNYAINFSPASGTVALIGSTVASFSAGTTGLTPNSATTGAVTLGGTLIVGNGGTGLATLTAHAVMLGEGTSNVAFATIGTSGRLLLDQGAGADPSFNAMSQDCTITNAGVITCLKTNNLAFASGATTATGTSGATLALLNGNNGWSGNETHSGTEAFTGTGSITTSAGQVYVGGTTSAPTLGANNSGALYLTAVNGLVQSGLGSTYDSTIANKSGSVAMGVSTGTVNVVFGGTITAASLATPSANIAGSLCATSGGGFLYNSGGNCYAGGTAASIDAGGATTTVANGTANDILYITGTSPLYVNKIATANSSVLVTNGSGVPSLSTTLPSGLSATNLTLVTPALGTPASGTVTNLTGTASININGTVGATTPTTGVFTTATATSFAGASSSNMVLNSNGTFMLFQFSGVNTFAAAATTLEPSTDLTVDLGTPSLRWTHAYIGTIVNSGIASGAQADVVCTTSAGVFTYQVSATGCAVSSERFKNMRPALSKSEISHLASSLVQAKAWTYKDPNFGDPSEYVGFTAEQIAAIDDRFITRDAEGLPYAVKHQQLAEAAIAGFALIIKELKADNDNLRAGVEALKRVQAR